MVNPNPPLFVQDGEYPAKLDRNLVGAMLPPSGSSTSPLTPRPGVRAHYVDGSGLETSLLVTAASTQVRIKPGSAFVPGPAADGIAGVYLITNPVEVPLTVDAVIPGATQTGMVGISVSDPSDVPGSGLEGKWEFVYISVTPTVEPVPANFLKLATVTIPSIAGQSVTVADARVFTTALGGTARVANRDVLTSQFGGYPYGSQAYSMADDLMYLRGASGWAPSPAVAVINPTASNAGIPGHPGQLMWNKVNNTLSVFVDGVWVLASQKPGSVKTAMSTTWPVGPNEEEINSASIKIYVPAGQWYSIGNSAVTVWGDSQNEVKATEQSLMLQAYSYAPGTKVTAHLYATVKAYLKDANGDFQPDITNTFWINLDAFTSTALVFGADGKPEGYVEQYAIVDPGGQIWTDQVVKKDFLKVMTNLNQGIANVRPVFKAQNNGYFEITDFHFQLSTEF